MRHFHVICDTPDNRQSIVAPGRTYERADAYAQRLADTYAAGYGNGSTVTPCTYVPGTFIVRRADGTRLASFAGVACYLNDCSAA